MSHATVDISHDSLEIRDLAPSLAQSALMVGGGGLLVALVLAFVGVDSGEGFFRAYVTGYMFCLTIALGGLFFVILQHLTRAGWSVVVRRLAENIAGTMPVMAVLSLPIVLPILLGYWTGWPAAIRQTYPWTDAEAMHANHALHGKTPYLNGGFFLVRMAFYFGFWCWAAGYFRGTSVAQDTEPSDDRRAEMTALMQRRSTWSMLLFALTLTFCAFDLLMSLDPKFFSTIFGVYVFAGASVSIYATMAVVLYWLQSRGRVQRAVSTEHFHDVGKLMFAFIVFWAYIGFSQYMLIWYANLPEEAYWYHLRQQGPWLFFCFVLLFGHFCAPFLYLISRWQKRNKNTLLAGAIWMLAMHYCDMIFLVFPHDAGDFFAHRGPEVRSLDAAGFGALDLLRCLACLGGIGGVFVWAIARKMGEAALVPRQDPRLHESLAFENI